MRAQSAVAVTVLMGLLSGCTDGATPGTGTNPGGGGSGGSVGGEPGSSSAECTTRPSLGADPLRLLTKLEYEATLRELFGPVAVDAASTQLAQLPDRRAPHGFRSMAKGTTGSEVEGYLMIADAISAYTTGSAERLSALATCLGATAPDETCPSSFISSWGQRLYRRPLTEAETAALTTLYGAGAAISPSDGARFVLFSMLQAPPFLYRLEIAGGARADKPGSYDLTGHEIATRLAYLAWGSAPDPQLLDRAQAGALAGAEGIGLELDRLLADPRASARQAQFFSEWLETEQLPTVNQGAEYLAGIPAEGLASIMKDETDQFVRSLAFTGQGSFRDLLTSNVSFVTSPALAQIYGVAPSAAADGRIELPAASRSGILTRAALLLSAGEQTSPIRRGAFVLRKLLCNAIPPPDPDAFPPGAIQPPEFSAEMTGRQRWTAKTSQGACAGCHGLLNPFGFALESYDNIGRYRTSEAIVDPTTGMKVSELPIDTEVDAALLDGDTPTHVSGGAVGLGAALADSPEAQACFGKQWFRFVSGREETAEDACVIGDIAAAVAKGESIRETFKRIALAPEFRMRRIDVQ